MRILPAGVLLATLLAGPARGDDSFAAVGAGSLVFQHADRIAMQREDLTISPAEIRVRYEMRNDRGAAYTGHVAFPFPVVDMAVLSHDAGAMRYGTNIEFLHFRLQVDGQPVVPALRVWATVRGRDVTALLHAQNIDLQQLPNQPPVLADLAPATVRALQAGGLMDRAGFPLWQLHVAYEWDQAFAPGITIVEQTYQPIAGSTLVQRADELAPPRFRDRPSCIGRATRDAAQVLLDEVHRTDKDGTLFLMSVGFILRTARNWDGPIGAFHLTLETRSTDELASVCLPGLDLVHTGPTRFEAQAHRWVATTDIDAVFVSKRPWP